MARGEWHEPHQAEHNGIWKARKYGVGFVSGFFGVMVVVVLARWFLSSILGNQLDPLFRPYPDGSGLYYFDAFSYLKMLTDSFDQFRVLFVEFAQSFNGSWKSDWLSNFVNVFIYVLNIVLFLIKLIFFIPLMILATIFGFTFPGWFGDGGWVTEFIKWTCPYVNFLGMLEDIIQIDLPDIPTFFVK